MSLICWFDNFNFIADLFDGIDRVVINAAVAIRLHLPLIMREEWIRYNDAELSVIRISIGDNLSFLKFNIRHELFLSF